MKNIITLSTFLLLLSTLSLNAQNIIVAFENAEITTIGNEEFYEVDVFITSDEDFIFGEGQFLYDYNTNAFGENSDAAGNIELITPVNSILGSTTSGITNYANLDSADSSSARVGISWSQFWNGGAIGINVFTTPTLLLRLKIKYIDSSQNPNICFTTFAALDDQFNTACGPFTPQLAPADCNGVNAGTQIFDFTPDCTGAELPAEICAGGVKTWDGDVWDGDGNAPDDTMTAIINGDYVTADQDNLDVCQLEITDIGSLTVSALGFARVQNNISNEGSLIVEHTANLVQVNDDAQVTNTGTIEVLVTTAEVAVRDFVMLGSPMDDETREDVWASAFNVQAFSPGLFEPFTEEQEAGVMFNFQGTSLDVWDPKSGVLNPGEGYLVFPQDAVNGPGGTFDYTYNTGTLNNGVYTRQLAFNGAPEGSPNMLSNPYASAIDAEEFFMQNPTITTVYFWEHVTPPSEDIPGPDTRNFSMRDVSAYNGTGGIPAASNPGETPTNVIASAQGFGVFAPSQTDAVFNNSMRLTSGNTTLRGTEVQKDRLWLRVDDLTYEEGATTLVGFVEGATAGFETRYDSPLIENTVSLYSYINDDFSAGYSIQGREVFDDEATVKLGFNTFIDEMVVYQISLSDFDGEAWEQNTVYLTDNTTGIVTNLSKSNYEFSATAGHYENRFLLSFKNNVLATDSFDESSIFLFPNPTNDYLEFSAPQTIIENITITDMKGRSILNYQNVNNTSKRMDVSTLQSGVYFATIQTEKGSINKRFIKK